jgi:hypothetical protein
VRIATGEMDDSVAPADMHDAAKPRQKHGVSRRRPNGRHAMGRPWRVGTQQRPCISSLRRCRLHRVRASRFAYIGIIVALVAKRAAPDWFIGSLEPYLASSTIGSPLYVVVGSIMLALSKRLAKFIAKHAAEESPGD